MKGLARALWKFCLMNCIVVGGGVIGLGVAWRAAQRGWKVAVVDSPSPNAATRVAAGLLILAGGKVSAHHLALRAASANLYPEFVADLEAATGLDCGYNPCGLMTVAYDPGADNAIDGLANCLRGLGVAVERLDQAACLELEPGLSQRVKAGFYTDDHQVDPEKLAACLRQAGSLLGVVFVQARVSAVEPRSVTLDNGERLEADRVVVAGGAWLADILSLPVFPVKGEVIHLKGPEGLVNHNLTLRKADLYVAHRGHGHYVVGATEVETGFDSATTATDLLFRKVCELVPALGECEIVDSRVGFRPKVGDGLPLLGEYQGIVVAGAHYRNGILLAPITAELIVDFLDTGKVSDLMKPFTPERDHRHRDDKVTA